ncbi:MAG: YARHG domain-containing protein [Bacteroidota bacterium]
MTNRTLYLVLFFSFIAFPSIGQQLVHSAVVDIDRDGAGEKILFYLADSSASDRNGFDQFCIISGTDTVWAENVHQDIWVKKQALYQQADQAIINRIGIFYENKKVYLWLTGPEKKCCQNITSVYEWNKKSLTPLFDHAFEIHGIETINGDRHAAGIKYMSDVYGDDEADYYFVSFYPFEYYDLTDDFKPNENLIHEKNIIYKKVEKAVDIYDAVVVHLKDTKEVFVISRALEASLSARQYGMLSLKRFDREYFQKYDKTELRIMRNELFAYHGYDFNSPDLKLHFSAKEWYQPTTIPSEEIYFELSDIEKFNIDLMYEVEMNDLK